MGQASSGICRDVREIGEVVDAEAERLDAAVLDAEGAEGDRPAGAVDHEGAVEGRRSRIGG